MVVLVDGVEMDRHSVDSLLIKEATVRDGAALSQQLSADVFSVTLFIIALASVSFGLYAMVLRRRMLAPETEEELADQTEVVARRDERRKAVPALAAVPQRRAAQCLHRPWPGLTAVNHRRFPRPASHKGGHRSNGIRTDGSTSTHFRRSEGPPCPMNPLTVWSQLTERTVNLVNQLNMPLVEVSLVLQEASQPVDEHAQSTPGKHR